MPICRLRNPSYAAAIELCVTNGSKRFGQPYRLDAVTRMSFLLKFPVPFLCTPVLWINDFRLVRPSARMSIWIMYMYYCGQPKFTIFEIFCLDALYIFKFAMTTCFDPSMENAENHSSRPTFSTILLQFSKFFNKTCQVIVLRHSKWVFKIWSRWRNFLNRL